MDTNRRSLSPSRCNHHIPSLDLMKRQYFGMRCKTDNFNIQSIHFNHEPTALELLGRHIFASVQVSIL